MIGLGPTISEIIYSVLLEAARNHRVALFKWNSQKKFNHSSAGPARCFSNSIRKHGVDFTIQTKLMQQGEEEAHTNHRRLYRSAGDRNFVDERIVPAR